MLGFLCRSGKGIGGCIGLCLCKCMCIMAVESCSLFPVVFLIGIVVACT